MCVVSMVYDHYQPLIPKTIEVDPIDTAYWEKVFEDFRKAKEAAETVDKLTGQPDCVDPEKAELLERIADLEQQLANARCKERELWFIVRKDNGKVASVPYISKEECYQKARDTAYFGLAHYSAVGPYRLDS